MSGRIRVLVVDDSALVRQILSQGLASDPAIEVVGSAADAYQARDLILQLRPDVLTLDVEMPRMNGVEFLRRLMPQYPVPVVMVSSLTQRGQQVTIDALAAGAVDFVPKPSSNMAVGVQAMLLELRAKVKMAATANVGHWRRTSPQQSAGRQVGIPRQPAGAERKLIAIGASTGGTEAIKEVLEKFPATTPPVVIVQHMPAGFTRIFAERLDSLCAMEVKEAEDGDLVAPGRVLIAPGGLHMRVRRVGGQVRVSCGAGDKVSGHCPSVDVLMHSVAEQLGRDAVGVMLTGMGGDGAEGMVAMRRAGARNIAQDEASCVVFGMPNVAFQKGGAEKLVPLDRIAAEVFRLLEGQP